MIIASMLASIVSTASCRADRSITSSSNSTQDRHSDNYDGIVFLTLLVDNRSVSGTLSGDSVEHRVRPALVRHGREGVLQQERVGLVVGATWSDASGSASCRRAEPGHAGASEPRERWSPRGDHFARDEAAIGEQALAQAAMQYGGVEGLLLAVANAKGAENVAVVCSEVGAILAALVAHSSWTPWRGSRCGAPLPCARLRSPLSPPGLVGQLAAHLKNVPAAFVPSIPYKNSLVKAVAEDAATAAQVQQRLETKSHLEGRGCCLSRGSTASRRQ